MFHYGPNGSFAIFQRWSWILILIPVIVALFFSLRLFLPELNKVKVTEKLEGRGEKEVVEDRVTEKIKGDDTDVEQGPSITSQEAPINVALRLLEPDERKVVEALIEAGGTLLQKEISWKTGYSRVKTHRILVRLIRRGVVTSEKYYNTNKITLSKWLHNHHQEYTK